MIPMHKWCASCSAQNKRHPAEDQMKPIHPATSSSSGTFANNASSRGSWAALLKITWKSTFDGVWWEGAAPKPSYPPIKRRSFQQVLFHRQVTFVDSAPMVLKETNINKMHTPSEGKKSGLNPSKKFWNTHRSQFKIDFPFICTAHYVTNILIHIVAPSRLILVRYTL